MKEFGWTERQFYEDMSPEGVIRLRFLTGLLNELASAQQAQNSPKSKHAPLSARMQQVEQIRANRRG